MIIDERTIQDGISVTLIAKLIERHAYEHERFSKLRRYYDGTHDILQRKQTSSGLANNRVVCNHAKYIVDMTSSYLAGNPITYSASDEYDIEAVKNAYLVEDVPRLDFELARTMSIYGRAYELVFTDDASTPKSAIISPEQAFVVYNDDCTHIPLFGVYYYVTRDIDGNVTGAVCNVYTDGNCYTYESRDGSFYNMELTADFEHYFGGVPLIEYINNTERRGDFEQLIPLMDAYNLLMSDRVNDKEQFVDSFLFLNNIEVDSEQQKKLRHEKILMAMDPDADAKYLSKVLSESDMKILRDDLKEDIHRFAMVPDMTDVNFSGNLSGVAIRYKLLTFEQHIKAKESYFTEGLKKRFALYNAVLEFRRLMAEVPVHRVDVVFTHNLPANNYEVSEMINNLSTLVTQETLLAQLDFVGDPKEEAALARDEQAEKREDAAAARTRADYSVRYGDEE